MSKYAWEFQQSDGTWVRHSYAHSFDLESKYNDYANSKSSYHRTLCVLGLQRQLHCVNFKNMTQRMLVNLKAAPIRRVSIERLQCRGLVMKLCESDIETECYHATSDSSDESEFDEHSKGLDEQVLDSSIGLNSCPTLTPQKEIKDVDPLNESTLSFETDIDRSFRSSPMRESICTDIGSMIATFNQAIEADGSPLLLQNVLDDFERDLESKLHALQKLRQQIDGIWLQELSIEIFAEMHSLVIEAATRIESGANPCTMISETLVQLQSMKSWLIEDLLTRHAQRDVIALEGGLDALLKIALEQYATAYQEVKPLLAMLGCQDELVEAKLASQQVVSNYTREHEMTSSLKEMNTDVFMCMCEQLDDTEEMNCTLALSYVRTARANPESLDLQRQVLEMLAKVFHIYTTNRSSGRHFKDGVPEFLDFILNALRRDSGLQDPACQALESVVVHGIPATLEKSCLCSLQECMANNLQDAPIQIRLCRVLLGIVAQGMQNKILLSQLGVIDLVLSILKCHRFDKAVQELGNQVLGVAVAAVNVHRALR